MEWILLGILLWFVVGLSHAEIQTTDFEKKLCRDHGVEFYFGNGDVVVIHPHRDTRNLVSRDFCFATILGPIGIVLIGADWIVRNWPECLVLGGKPAKPATATVAPTVANNDVNLEPYRQKAGIFNNK